MLQYSMTSNNALSDDAIKASAPAVFAEQPKSDVSDRYGFVPTISVVNSLRDEGWFPVKAMQGRSHDEIGRASARHMLRFRRKGDDIQVGDCLAELVLSNSHDRTSCYSLDVGLFRLVCLNGMVVSTADFGGIKVRHSSRVVEEIIDASYEIIDGVPIIADQLERFQSIDLQPPERKIFADSAMVARYGENWQIDAPITPDAILQPRRFDDTGSDLWSTLNVVQENLMRGNVPGFNRSNRRTRTRPITSVREDLRLNKALWTLADRMAELVT